MASIYGLYDDKGRLRYIGKANDPTARLKTHISDARRHNRPVCAWINKHGSPVMRVLEANCADWRESERRLIAEARKRGDRLLNLADGGDEPHCPLETREENARKMQAHPNTIAQRYKNAGSLKGAYADPVFVATNNVIRRLGSLLREYTKNGFSTEEIERRRTSLRRMKEFARKNRELFFFRLVQAPTFHSMMAGGDKRIKELLNEQAS